MHPIRYVNKNADGSYEYLSMQPVLLLPKPTLGDILRRVGGRYDRDAELRGCCSESVAVTLTPNFEIIHHRGRPSTPAFRPIAAWKNTQVGER